MVGVGFFAGSILVRPFLPEDSKSGKGTSEVCSGPNVQIKKNGSGFENGDALVGDIHNISWPFVITGLMTILFSAGYFILGKSSLKTLFIQKIKSAFSQTSPAAIRDANAREFCQDVPATRAT